MKRVFRQFKNHYSAFFVGMLLLSLAVYLLSGLFTGGKSLLQVFFRETDDLFMDFFNSVRDSSQGAASYTERHVIYPPMANLIFLLFSLITPDAYNNTSFEDRYTWKNYPINHVLIWTFVVISAALFAWIVYRALKAGKTKKFLLAFVAVFSVPFLNMMERGNIMILAFLALMVFVMTYDSESAWKRELGIIALAFSFSIKLYPVIFAWILFTDKRYKEFFRCALYSLALLILPSFFFGGPICLLWIVQNILSFSSGGSANAMPIISMYTKIPEFILTGGINLLFVLAVLSFVIAPFVHKERWKVWALGCIAFVSYPPLASTYAWTLFIIPILFLCNEGCDENWLRAGGRKRYLIPMLVPFLFFFVPLSAIPLFNMISARWGTALYINAIAVYLFILILAICGIIDTVIATVKRISEKRKKSSAPEQSEA